MYRQYEDPWKLEEEYSKLKAEYEWMERHSDNYYAEDFANIAIDLEDLRQRINFAWQDQEYDVEYRALYEL